jgi:hypothetical protein
LSKLRSRLWQLGVEASGLKGQGSRQTYKLFSLSCNIQKTACHRPGRKLNANSLVRFGLRRSRSGILCLARRLLKDEENESLPETGVWFSRSLEVLPAFRQSTRGDQTTFSPSYSRQNQISRPPPPATCLPPQVALFLRSAWPLLIQSDRASQSYLAAHPKPTPMPTTFAMAFCARIAVGFEPLAYLAALRAKPGGDALATIVSMPFVAGHGYLPSICAVGVMVISDDMQNGQAIGGS